MGCYGRDSNWCKWKTPVFEHQRGLVPSTLQYMCLSVLAKEDVLLRIGQKMAINATYSPSKRSYTNTQQDICCQNGIDLSRPFLPMNGKLFDYLMHFSNIVIVLSKVAKEIIEELHVHKVKSFIMCSKPMYMWHYNVTIDETMFLQLNTCISSEMPNSGTETFQTSTFLNILQRNAELRHCNKRSLENNFILRRNWN